MQTKETIAQRLAEAQQLVYSLEQQYRKVAQELSHPKEMAQQYLPGLPDSLVQDVYEFAWNEAQDEDLDTVEAYYVAVAELVMEAWNLAQS